MMIQILKNYLNYHTVNHIVSELSDTQKVSELLNNQDYLKSKTLKMSRI